MISKDIKNILVVRLGSIGEVLMTTPALRAIKETVSNAQITILTLSDSKKICGLIPEIDDVIVFDSPWVHASKITSREFFLIKDELEKRKFDASIIFNNYYKSPFPEFMLSFFANIPVRAGFSKENPNSLLTHWIYDEEPINFTRHEVRRHLDLVSALGFKTNNEKLSLRVTESVKRKVTRYLEKKRVYAKNKLIVVDLETFGPDREYLTGELANACKIIDELGCQVIVTWSLKEIGRKLRLPVFEKTSVKDLCSLVLASSVVISNNNSFIQIASALDVPVIAFCDKYNFQTPWMVKSDVLCSNVSENLHSKNIFLQDFIFSGYSKLTSAQIVKSIRKILNIKPKRFTAHRFARGFAQPVLF